MHLWLSICVSTLQCWDPCAPMVTNMCIYITILGSRLWLNSQFISILGFQATNMLSYFTILGTCVHLTSPIILCVSKLQCWNLCAPLVTNMCIYITMLGSRLWLNSQIISILGFQATNMLSYFTILGTCVHLWLPICVSTLQCWDPCAPLVTNMVYLHYNVGIQVVVEFPIYFHSCIPGYQYAVLFHDLGNLCAPLVTNMYLHYNVGIQVVVEFPIYFYSWTPGYQYAVLFHNLGNLCAPLVTNMCIYITMLGSRLWLNSQFISILVFQATNMLSYFTILGTCVHLWLSIICVSTLQCWDPGCG